jgi:hypothetical protein
MASLPEAIAVGNGTVLMLVTLIVLPIAAIAFARSGAAWKELGKGAFGIEQELPPPSSAPRPEAPVDRELQATEARQMLEAKSYRREQRGEAPLDIEAEVARLLDSDAATPPAIDEKLRTEIRQLVIAQNERRIRQGRDPLDVEAETERQLANLIGSS